jgi:excisionase family DNA binding protein
MSVTETRLITIVQAAEIVGLSRSKLYELLESRELPSVRIGRARRIDVADPERFIARHRVPPRPDVAVMADLAGTGDEAPR